MPGEESGNSPPTKRWMRARDLIFALGFLIFWLLPMLSEGVLRQPLHAWLPENFHDQYRIVCLFSFSNQFKLEYYVEGKARDGEWFELPDAKYTPMQPFGYVNRNWAMMYGINSLAIRQTRLHQEIAEEPAPAEDVRRRRALEQREIDERRRAGAELASWYRERHAAKHPDEPKLASVRFLAVWHPVGSEIASPPGHWRRSRVEDLPAERVHEILRRDFGGR